MTIENKLNDNLFLTYTFVAYLRTMTNRILELQTRLKPNPKSDFKVFGLPYDLISPSLLHFQEILDASEDFGKDWKRLQFELSAGLDDKESIEADLRLILLYNKYVLMARAVEEMEDLPEHMIQWLGTEENGLLAENPTWFLVETKGIGSESAVDLINVLGFELNFVQTMLGEGENKEVLAQAGVFLARLLHLKSKWPAEYNWAGMEARTRSMKDFFLYGSEEFEIFEGKGRKSSLKPEYLEVYQELSRSMYQLPFFLLLKDYAEAMQKSKGFVTKEIEGILRQLAKA